MDAPVLDRDHLARYTVGDSGLEAELFALLDGQIEACTRTLRTTADAEAWAAAAHTLKGAARGVGAMALGAACERAEARPLDPSALAAVLAAAEDARAAIIAAQAAA
ncbi:MAG: Hpt domain-containing protein [Oceanicaulis sp.]